MFAKNTHKFDEFFTSVCHDVLPELEVCHLKCLYLEVLLLVSQPKNEKYNFRSRLVIELEMS